MITIRIMPMKSSFETLPVRRSKNELEKTTNATIAGSIKIKDASI